MKDNMSHHMGKPTICTGENKGADQLRRNCEADQRLCFRHMDSTIPLPSKSKISSLEPSSVTVQPSLCRTRSEPKLLVFSRTGSYFFSSAMSLQMSHLVGKPTMWFPNRSYTNRPVQAQKRARSLKFGI